MTVVDQTKEQELAALMKGVKEKVDTDLKELTDEISGVKSELAKFDGIDIRKVVEELAYQKGQTEALRTAIRQSKRGVYVPGLGDEAHKFSLGKAIVGMRLGGRKRDFDSIKAGQEFEMLRAAQQKLLEVEGGSQSGTVTRAQIAADDALGGSFIPDQLIADVIEPFYTRSAFVALDGDGDTRVTVVDGLTGGEVKIPVFEGGMVAEWAGEVSGGPETQATVATKKMTAKEAKAHFAITKTLMQMAGFGLDAKLRKDLIKALVKLIDWTVPYGLGGAHQPLGIIGTQGISFYRAEDGTLFESKAALLAEGGGPDWQGGAFTFETLSKMRTILERRDIDPEGASTVSCPDLFRSMKDARTSFWSSQPDAEKGYLVGIPFIPDARLRELIGDFGKSTQIRFDKLPGASVGAATTSTDEKFTDVFYGDLSEVLLGRWAGIEIEDDGGRGAGFRDGITYVKASLRMDLMVGQPETIIVCPDAQAIA